MATAWQYLAGAGLVAALCPLQAQVAVAGEGYGDAAGGTTGGVVVRQTLTVVVILVMTAICVIGTELSAHLQDIL
ncbi:hypothetical protein ACWCY1_33495, partial [Streptomyces goshikiensis]